MFNPSKEDVRQFFVETWDKHRKQVPLTGMESMLAAIIMDHPEYQALLDSADRAREKDYLPESGETNPFLHMSMHLAIEEQLAINQPPGIKALYELLLQKSGDEHAAQHEVMDCLGEMLWQSQRYQTAPDAAVYLACLRHKAGQGEG